MWNDIAKHAIELVIRHPGKALGALIGLVVGLLVVLFGVLRALFLLACVIGGLYIGALIDDNGRAPSLALRNKSRGRWER